MNKNSMYKSLRYCLTVISTVCLIVAIGWLFHLIVTEHKEKQIETPMKVSHKVLFLSSYNSLYYTYDAQQKGLSESLYPLGIEYDVTYMDAKKYGTKEDVEAFYQLLKQHLSHNNQYEAVLVGDDDALDFVLTYREELFADKPIVFFGINEMPLAERGAACDHMTGFYEKDYLKETMELAMRLFPDNLEYVALHDDSPAGEADKKQFYIYAEKHPECSFHDIDTSTMSQQELETALEEIPEDAVLLYLTAYSDKYGNIYSMRSRTSQVVEHAGCPIFRSHSGGEGTGILGGISMDFEYQCRKAGEIMGKALDGADISKVPLQMETPGRAAFDFQLMRKYGLDFSLLPKDTVYYNRPEMFFDRYGKVMFPIALIILGMFLFSCHAKLGTLMVEMTNRELQDSWNSLEESRNKLKYRAEYDEFLEILNRRTVTEQIKTCFQKDDLYSVVMADLDGFKEINETYGHKAADDMLKALAGELKELAAQHQWLLGRYGGDEFVLVVPRRIITEEDEEIAQILDVFRTEVLIEGETVSMTASIGISGSDGITSAEQHIINAEMAMYEAKARGRNGAFVYADEMKAKVREENRIKGKLLEAFEQDGFYMLYQPQIDARTKQVNGFEALVRMKEPGMYPGQFIPVAEKNGWIWKIGRITTELVIRQLAQWQQQGYTLHPVSVNFSSNQLNDAGYIAFVQNLLETYHIPPKYLEIEITEGVFLDRTAQAQELFDRFKDLNIRLLMDDFGTGYSSLGYLTYIPVDVIKLDKSLVDAYLVDGKDMFIHDVIRLVHDLDKEIIIEGVEKEWQFLRLQEFGADTIQGYYFSKPIPSEEAIGFQV